jgi:nicotinamide N-methyltransferase
VTDYPDADLIDNLRLNIADCSLLPDTSNIHAEVQLHFRDIHTASAKNNV